MQASGLNHSAEFRRCMLDLDTRAAIALWSLVFPHLPGPKSANAALVMLHHARAQSEAIPLQLRAYSHRWLLDNGYPSGLPDALRPKVERLYPQIVDGVGISVNTKSELFRPVVPYVERAMSTAVLEAYADRIVDPQLIKQSMFRARKSTIHKLLRIG